MRAMRIQQRAISSTAAFAVKQTAGYESLVRKVADKLLSGLPDSGEVDIVDAFTMGPSSAQLSRAWKFESRSPHSLSASTVTRWTPSALCGNAPLASAGRSRSR